MGATNSIRLAHALPVSRLLQEMSEKRMRWWISPGRMLFSKMSSCIFFFFFNVLPSFFCPNTWFCSKMPWGTFVRLWSVFALWTLTKSAFHQPGTSPAWHLDCYLNSLPCGRKCLQIFFDTQGSKVDRCYVSCSPPPLPVESKFLFHVTTNYFWYLRAWWHILL